MSFEKKNSWIASSNNNAQTIFSFLFWVSDQWKKKENNKKHSLRDDLLRNEMNFYSVHDRIRSFVTFTQILQRESWAIAKQQRRIYGHYYL